MIFNSTKLAGVYLIQPDMYDDERGSLTSLWTREDFKKNGLSSDFVQSNISQNHKRGTVRGMHYQAKPAEEDKLVHCLKGAIHDIVLDIRLDSKTYGQHLSFELSERNKQLLYIPKGCAHGFQTLKDASLVLYVLTTAFIPSLARTIHWNDPSFRISWPLSISIISQKDAKKTNFDSLKK